MLSSGLHPANAMRWKDYRKVIVPTFDQSGRPSLTYFTCIVGERASPFLAFLILIICLATTVSALAGDNIPDPVKLCIAIGYSPASCWRSQHCISIAFSAV